MRKLLLLFLFSICLNIDLKAQTNSTSVINAAGGTITNSQYVFDFNIGEISIETVSSSPFVLTQGFLQPIIQLFAPEPMFLRQVNNLISPNGDGKNDVLFFTGLEIYPQNKISIVNRAGRIIFTASPYKNDFNAIIDGKLLSEDTYYYLFEEGAFRRKGFFSVVHDKY